MRRLGCASWPPPRSDGSPRETPKRAWHTLDEIAYVGPKIASWILRDLSFLRDYSDDTGRFQVRYRNERDAAWFGRLSVPQQALFVPLDRWVIRGAKSRGVLPKNAQVSVIQVNQRKYLEAAERVARWARTERLDPRDVDVYLYLI